MKKAITILAVCGLMLTACGQTDNTESKAETTTAIASKSTSDTETSSSEEKDTGEATTTALKTSSRTVSSASDPTGIAVTTAKKSDSSNTNGNSVQGQNTAVEGNNQTARSDRQSNTPFGNSQGNNSAEKNAQPSNEKPQNVAQSTTAKPAVTNPPVITTKPRTTTAPQTEPPSPKPTEEERYMDIGRSLSHNGFDYSKAEAVYNWMTENGSGTCVNYSWQTYYLCKGTGLECYLVWTPSKLYGHVANVVKVNGAWFVLDTQGQGFLLNNDCGFSEIIDIDESYISEADLISSQRYDDIY